MGSQKRLIEEMLDRRRSKNLASRNKLKNLPFELSLDSINEANAAERRQDKERVRQFNAEVKKWSEGVVVKLKNNVRALVKRDRFLSESIEPRFYKKKGEIVRIGFSFRREGVYIHKGAGRGYGGFHGGSKWTDKYGRLKTTNEDSLKKMNSGKRLAIPWFDPVISANLGALADIVANYSADLVVNSTAIFIDK